MEKTNSTVICIDKPKGISSFSAIQEVKRLYGAKKVGHAGTLDPLASGLLVVGINEGTKQLRHIVDDRKVYEAHICIGERSATGDAEGPIIESVPVAKIEKTTVEHTLNEMVGVLRLPVSIYSAMKRGGEPLYKKARRGERVTQPIRDMELIEVTLLGGPETKEDTVNVHVRMTVGSGTYVRSLAEELGRRLGYPARLEDLRRTQVGAYHIEEALPLPEILH